jgi:hypothetical protein
MAEGRDPNPYICRALKAGSETASELIIEVQVVRVYAQGFDKPPVKYDRPNYQHRRRDQESKESYLWRPAEKETVSPRRGNKKYKRGGYA